MDEIPPTVRVDIVSRILSLLNKTLVGNHILEQNEELMKKKEEMDISSDLVEWLYSVLQTIPKQKDGPDADFMKKLCMDIVHFTNPKHQAITQVYTYGILAQVNAYLGLPKMIKDCGIPSVPKRILDAADSQGDDNLKKKVRELHDSLADHEMITDPGTSVQETHSGDESPSVTVTTVTTPRRLEKSSVRWGAKLEKLASMGMTEIKRVNNFIFCIHPDYLIARGSDGTEVFLGLRDDGTEVAIKRMTKSNYQLLEHEEQILRLPELDSPTIVRYVDSVEDHNFRYLVLQLCEYTLEEYVDQNCLRLPEDVQKKMNILKTKVWEVLHAVNVLHKGKVLHGAINPQNVLIAITGKATLAGFGKSRRLDVGLLGQTTVSRDALEEDTNSAYEMSSEIQDIGMLIYYILSRGHHLFGDKHNCEANILEDNLDLVEDELAKDLIEWMIQAEPSSRPRAEQTVAHAYFWDNDRRVKYLTKVGNMPEVEYPAADDSLLEDLQTCSNGRSFSSWKDKFPPELIEKLETKGGKSKKRRDYPNNTLGLLRFIRNLYAHYEDDDEMDKIDLMILFPDLFPCIYMFAKAKGWNSRRSLKILFNASS